MGKIGQFKGDSKDTGGKRNELYSKTHDSITWI